MTDPFATPAPEIGRDRYGRPLVTPPEGGKPRPYMRATTLAGTLDDTFNLSRWQQRMVAIGLADRPDLLLAATAHREDKNRLNQICADAIEAARGHAAATTGTAVHALTEMVDRGMDLPVVPDGAAADLAAYQQVTTAAFDRILAIEQFCVLDDLQVGGTPDRIVTVNGINVIADIKTGSIEWAIGKISIQLALYARAQAYDIPTGTRTPLPDVDQSNGLIIHLPAGQGVCELVWVNIAAGWEAAQLAMQVRGWRSRKGLTAPFQPATEQVA